MKDTNINNSNKTTFISDTLVENTDYYNDFINDVKCLHCNGLLNTPVMCTTCETPFCKDCTSKMKGCLNNCKGSLNTCKISKHLVSIIDKILINCPNCKDTFTLDRYPLHMESCNYITCILCNKASISKKDLKLKPCAPDVTQEFLNQNKQFINISNEDCLKYEKQMSILEDKIGTFCKIEKNINILVEQINALTINVKKLEYENGELKKDLVMKKNEANIDRDNKDQLANSFIPPFPNEKSKCNSSQCKSDTITLESHLSKIQRERKALNDELATLKSSYTSYTYKYNELEGDFVSNFLIGNFSYSI